MLPCQQKNASMAVLSDGLHSYFSVTSCAEIAATGASYLSRFRFKTRSACLRRLKEIPLIYLVSITNDAGFLLQGRREAPPPPPTALPPTTLLSPLNNGLSSFAPSPFVISNNQRINLSEP